MLHAKMASVRVAGMVECTQKQTGLAEKGSCETFEIAEAPDKF